MLMNLSFVSRDSPSERHDLYGDGSRRRDCHSAPSPSPFSMRFNMDGEGVSAN